MGGMKITMKYPCNESGLAYEELNIYSSSITFPCDSQIELALLNFPMVSSYICQMLLIMKCCPQVDQYPKCWIPCHNSGVHILFDCLDKTFRMRRYFSVTGYVIVPLTFLYLTWYFPGFTLYSSFSLQDLCLLSGHWWMYLQTDLHPTNLFSFHFSDPLIPLPLPFVYRMFTCLLS